MTRQASLQSIISRATTTRNIWEILSNTYGKSSSGCIHQIRDQLKESTKGTKFVHDYLRGIINKADQIALLDAPLPHEDLLEYITSSLNDDYRAIVEMVQGRDTPISIEELHEKLINRENALKAVGDTNLSVLAIANVTHLSRQSPRGGFTSSRGGFHSSRGGFRLSCPYLGKCQLCGLQGHGAKLCPQHQQQSQQFSYHAPQFNQFCGSTPSQTPHLPLPAPQWRAQAHYITTGSQANVTPWLLDSTASHHIASDLSTLSLQTPYNGSDNVMVGNGTGLPISHTGLVSLLSHFKPLKLQNVLCVPEMRRNLIYLNKLCKTNNVMVQLCPYYFQVKDLHTGTTLLKGKANEGV
ncbi:PREDICTED: uncharacterized protein LOC104728598 [Camelina sativa]|uniref:Uncharacterized protein LOC104728598 n=1 Tax=Camelina sativa TaxID=90675 RepID=A0ABM0UT16_CAMSA|nr:PREDICTED: uncharacterized protein LOC104728598 [Camelina sativa]